MFGLSAFYGGLKHETQRFNATAASLGATLLVLSAIGARGAAVNIAIGSPIQVALFVAPVLLFLSYFIGPRPRDLVFTTLEVFAVAIAVGIIAVAAQDGESHWMEGVQLLAVYAILGIAFYFMPG